MIDKNISVFGDSLVYGMGDSKEGGWVNRLQHKIKKSNKFWNFGIPGDTSADLLKRIKEELEEKNPDKVIVLIGTNDSQYKENKENTLIKPEEFKSNLTKILQNIKKYTSDVTFIGLPKMNDPITTNWEYIYNFCNENLIKYDKIIEEFSEENNLQYIGIFNLLNEEDLSDGAHPNSKGYEKIANKIEKDLIF